MADRAGQQLGNYRLTRLLGKGGFAEVYLGEHVYLKSLAAIKVMHARLADEDMERFLSEARTVVNLTHPLIVRVLDFGVEGNTPFLVMDYAPNGTLRQRHPKGTVVPLATVVDYVKQLADALQYAHDQKLVHRDIKPENMLLGRNSEVLLSDFGIAIVTQTSLHQGIQDIAGTIAYMAPEQLQGYSRPASDQYSLGVVIYEWLSGGRPFHRSSLEAAAKRPFDPPPPLLEKIPTLPPAVESLVLTALAKDPHMRFASVKDFAALLELAASHTSPPARVIMPLNSSPQPDVTLIASSLAPQLSDAVATTPPNQPSLSGGMATPPDHTLPARVTNPPARGSTVTPLPTGESISSDKSKASKRGISRLALLVGLLGLVFLVIAGSFVLFSPALMKLVITPKLSPSNAHTTSCVTAHPSSSTNYAMFGFNPQHTHFVPDERRLLPTNVSRLVTCWTAPTGGKIYSSPAVLDGIVYVGSGNKLYAFNATTGTQFWIAPTGGKIWSSPAVANGIVYIGSDDHRLYAFDATTGAQLWTATTGGDIYTSSPVLANGVIYVGSLDGKLYAFNATTGAQLWAARTGNYIHSSPALANGVVYVGSYDGKLYAFNATTGTQLWTALIKGKICSSPALANGVVYVGSLNTKLYAFNATTGAQLWTARTGHYIYSSPALANGVVYVGSYDGKLYAFHLPDKNKTS